MNVISFADYHNLKIEITEQLLEYQISFDIIHDKYIHDLIITVKIPDINFEGFFLIVKDFKKNHLKYIVYSELVHINIETPTLEKAIFKLILLIKKHNRTLSSVG